MYNGRAEAGMREWCNILKMEGWKLRGGCENEIRVQGD